MATEAAIESAIWHVRQIGGNPSIRDALSAALGHHAIIHKRELRAIGMGCGDDYVATSIEQTLTKEGMLHASH